MIPSLSHIQPLVKDLSEQPVGKYLLTIYGTSTRKYFFVDSLVCQKGTHFAAYRHGMRDPELVFPVGSLWLLQHTQNLEFPTMDEINRQGRVDMTALKRLQDELYPDNGKEPAEVRVPLQSSPSLDVPTGQYL